MKYCTVSGVPKNNAVAPLAGAWIEILTATQKAMLEEVAPLAGAWIEIIVEDASFAEVPVAPLAGAWIEITISSIITS